MNKIDNIGLTRILTQSYDFQGFTEQEVWSRIAQRMNIIIEHFNYLEKTLNDKQEIINQKLEYLLSNGIDKEVTKYILSLINDGTILKLIDEQLLNNINSKIETNYKELDTKILELINSTNNKTIEINNIIETLKSELNTTINNDMVLVNKSITDNIAVVNKSIEDNNTLLNDKITENNNNVSALNNKSATKDLLSLNSNNVSCNTSTYMFSVKEDKNMQSLCYVNGHLYVGFDIGDGTNAMIIKYDLSGKEVTRSSNIEVGHCSSIAYDSINNKLLITNGSLVDTKVYVVDPITFDIERISTYNDLGKSALITFDIKSKCKILHVGVSDNSPKQFYKINELSEIELLFKMDSLGTPQGLSVHGNSLFYLTNTGLYELDYKGNILNTITLYNDNSEPQGLTIAEINGTETIIYGKNKYNSDTNVNTIYSITNLEAHKKTSLRMIGSYANKDNTNIFLSPVMVNLGVRKLSGTWQVMNWGNYVTSSDNIIKEITSGMNSTTGYYDVTIKLNVKLHSYAQCVVTPEQSLFIDGYITHGQLSADGQTLNVRFKNSNADGIIDPNTLKDGHGVLITLIGGMKI